LLQVVGLLVSGGHCIAAISARELYKQQPPTDGAQAEGRSQLHSSIQRELFAGNGFAPPSSRRHLCFHLGPGGRSGSLRPLRLLATQAPGQPAGLQVGGLGLPATGAVGTGGGGGWWAVAGRRVGGQAGARAVYCLVASL
jgi:hypothetical protein